MPLEPSVVDIDDLNPVWPAPADPKSDGDDHIRELKKALLNDFAGYTGAIAVTGTDGGVVNAYTVTPTTSLQIPAYGLRMVVAFSPTIGNTGASTLNVSALGVKPLRTVSGAELVTGDLIPGVVYGALYNGTEFRLVSVTKNYIDQLAFNPVLPAQAGNKNKFLRTSGASAYWDFPGIATVNATVTTNTTLIGTFLLVPVQMAAMGSSITLPDATTLTVGGPQYIIDNSKGAYAAGIRDNAGTLLTAVVPGGIAMVSLKDASTAAGAWVINGTGLEPGLITLDQTLSTTYGTTVFPAFVAMDANTSVHFAALANGYAAFVVDNAGKVISTPVAIDATPGEAPKTAFKIDATRLIVFTAAKAVVLTLTGTSPSLSISVGTLTAFANNDDGVGSPKLAQLSPTLYVTTNGLVSQALSVSGTTITVGATATVAGDQTGDVAIYALTTTTALIIYSPNTASSVRAYVATVAGVTITNGTVATTSTVGTTRATCLLSPTKAIAMGAAIGAASGNAVAITVAGTTVTIGAPVTVASGTPNVGYSDNNATRFNPRLSPVSANSALLWYIGASSATSQAVVLSESSGIITAGASLAGTFSSGFVAGESTSDFIAINNTGSSGSLRFTVVPHKIASTAITYGNSQQVPELSPATTAGATPAARLPQGDYLIAASGIAAIPVFRSYGDIAIKRGSIAVPSLGGPSNYPLMTVSANRLVLAGPAGTQFRLLNIEVAA
jgi:hypothetical protein